MEINSDQLTTKLQESSTTYNCLLPNCMHVIEKGNAILEAYKAGEISNKELARYQKEMRTKFYDTDKSQYKKNKDCFKLGVSKSFRNKKKIEIYENEQIQEQTRLAQECESEDTYGEVNATTYNEASHEYDDTSNEQSNICYNRISLDYTNIKEEFKKENKHFPLKPNECIGLTDAQLKEINPCGTYCGGCEDYGVVCDGCRNRLGKPIWYDLYDKKEPCAYYTCTNNRSIHDCSNCNQLPCKEYFNYPDPNMTDEFKQYWLDLRIKNFKKVNPNIHIELEEEFQQNVKKFR